MIRALDPDDSRAFEIAVAGPAALLVSKLHKIRERIAERQQRRLDDKDALDILRLLQATPTEELVGVFRRLTANAVAATVTREAISALEDLFGDARGPGAQMAVRAAGPLADPSLIAESCAILASDLINALGSN
jgi:hypothetical protein